VGILNEFERRLEGVIEGIFSKAFRTGLQPVELARRILREMEAHKTVGVRDVWVPNRYAFTLSPDDFERFEGTERALRRELEQVVVDGARERGWSLVGPPEVAFEVDPELDHGRFGCEAALVEASTGSLEARPVTPAEPAATPEPPQEYDLALVEGEDEAKVFPLTKPRVLIGRLAESDVVLTDPGVSRTHAEVRRENGRWVITDLGSTNGTRVNDSSIATWVLGEGDRITVGSTVLEFRRR
jgi:hypothetical protein